MINLSRQMSWMAVFGAMLGIFLIAPFAQAFKVTPFIASFAPSGPQSQQTFRIENEAPFPVAIQVFAFQRDMNETGEEKLTPADDDFAIFPDQILLKSGESRTVRVKWMGEAKPQSELPYRLIFEQLPVQMQDDKSQGGLFNMMLRYETAVYITPAQAQPMIGVQKIEATPGLLKMWVSNTGTRHFNLRGFVLNLSLNDGRKVSIDGERIQGMAGENILPGRTRQFTIRMPSELAQSAVVNASLEFQSQ